jgi:hypothetical protein
LNAILTERAVSNQSQWESNEQNPNKQESEEGNSCKLWQAQKTKWIEPRLSLQHRAERGVPHMSGIRLQILN